MPVARDCSGRIHSFHTLLISLSYNINNSDVYFFSPSLRGVLKSLNVAIPL